MSALKQVLFGTFNFQFFFKILNTPIFMILFIFLGRKQDLTPP